MKKIIPFKKNLNFKTNVSEITSISLENTLQKNKNNVEGDLIITGNYKITDTSTNVDNFEFKIPVNIEIDKKYIIDNMVIDIDDFYYEIINNNTLEVSIDVMLDNIVEKQMIKQVEEFELIKDLKEEINKENEERCIEEESPKEMSEIFETINNEKEDYSTYHVYIVREGDTLENIISKYNTTKEKLEPYNDLNEIKLGDKIIIPA